MQHADVGWRCEKSDGEAGGDREAVIFRGIGLAP